MSNKEVHNILPAGWETSPEQEIWPLSTIDACPVCSYCQYIVPFKLDDSQRDQVKTVLKQGLEKTLSEVRFLCSRIEDSVDEGLMFVKRRDTTIPFHVQYLDSPEEGHPSFRDLEEAHFSQAALGRHDVWGIKDMQWGVRPESQPEAQPVACGFAADFVRGGLVLSFHFHHYANDVMGFSYFTNQLADNCKAIMGKAEFPGFDPANMDASRFTKSVPKDERVDGPPLPPPYPHTELTGILVHLPKGKAAELKKLATPPDGWISTYDAVSAFIWQQLTKIRAPHYQSDRTSTPYFGEAINMRPRVRNPALPSRFMRNALAGGFSPTAPVRPRTVDEIVSEPLAATAAYVRALTNSVTAAHVEVLMGMIAPIRDKRSISLDLKSLAPLSIWVTSHREADPSGYNFGFGKPKTHRCFWGGDLNNGLVTMYPAISTDRPDEGWSISICMEKELVPKLLEDPEWTRFIEYRGID